MKRFAHVFVQLTATEVPPENADQRKTSPGGTMPFGTASEKYVSETETPKIRSPRSWACALPVWLLQRINKTAQTVPKSRRPNRRQPFLTGPDVSWLVRQENPKARGERTNNICPL